MEAKAEMTLGNVGRTVSITVPILRAEPKNTDACTVRGKGLLLCGEFDQALQHLELVVRLDPDSISAGKVFKTTRKVKAASKQGYDQYGTRKFDKAKVSFTTCIEMLQEIIGEIPKDGKFPPIVVSFLAMRGSCFIRLHQYEKALRDANNALYNEEDCKKAHVVRASALTQLGRPEEAVKGLEEALKFSHDPVLKGAHERALFEYRKKKRPDYYKILGVSKTASTNEIKMAYKARALECHPDRHINDSAEKQKEAEEKFKLLLEALDILNGDNPLKRQLYNEGYDKKRIDERVERAQKEAHRSDHDHR